MDTLMFLLWRVQTPLPWNTTCWNANCTVNLCSTENPWVDSTLFPHSGALEFFETLTSKGRWSHKREIVWQNLHHWSDSETFHKHSTQAATWKGEWWTWRCFQIQESLYWWNNFPLQRVRARHKMEQFYCTVPIIKFYILLSVMWSVLSSGTITHQCHILFLHHLLSMKLWWFH